MKGFTKIALILSLILVVLGSMCCMIGLGIGFNFGEFWEEVEDGEYSIGPLGRLPVVFYRNRTNWHDDGESWNSADTEQYSFSRKDGIQSLDLDVYYGTVTIEENQDTEEMQVLVEYRKSNHRRKVEAYMDGSVLKIKETGSKHSFQNDSTKITVSIPSEFLETNELLREISLKQDAGKIYVNTPLTAEVININVNAGECEAEEKLKALEKFQADVGAGEMELLDVEAREIDLVADIGQITTERMKADRINIDCGIGSVEAEAEGKEEDYSYEVKCDVGNVMIGEDSFRGLGNQRKIEHDNEKEITVKCDIGKVEISFTESL